MYAKMSRSKMLRVLVNQLSHSALKHSMLGKTSIKRHFEICQDIESTVDSTLFEPCVPAGLVRFSPQQYL